MSLIPILEAELFNVWRTNFIGLFPSSYTNQYVLVVVEYVSKSMQAVAASTNDARVVINFMKRNIFFTSALLEPLSVMVIKTSLITYWAQL